MRVRDVCSGEILEVNACYAARLVEQGMAVVVRDAAGDGGGTGKPAPYGGSAGTRRKRSGKGDSDGAGG